MTSTNDLRLALFTMAIDTHAARAWLPLGLQPAYPGRATVFVADRGGYREAGVVLHARRHGRRLLHVAWSVVTADRPPFAAAPARRASIDFTSNEDGRCHAVVRRLGAEILSLTTEPSWTRHGDPAPIVDVCSLPGELPVAIFDTHHVRAAWGTLCDVTVTGSAADPLQQLLGAGAHRVAGVSMSRTPEPPLGA